MTSELLDEMSIRAFNQSVKNEELKPMDEKATLFFEFAGHSESSVIADLSAARAVCVDDFEGSNFVSATELENSPSRCLSLLLTDPRYEH